ncbi:MAG: PepSY domain-containing protein [Lachnospiraceae bacterium]|nr:PepSY domain-containing protein [Lachnospiraceae bacterium]
MMKKMIAAAVITVMTMSAALPVFAAPARGTSTAPAQQQTQGYTQNAGYSRGTRQAAPAMQNCISQDEALQIAMDHAGVTERDVTWPRVHMDFEHGYQIYEVEFHVGWTEYNYDIDAVSGQILAYESDWDD